MSDGDRFAMHRLGGDLCDCDVRVSIEETEELAACVARATDDTDAE